MGPNGRKIKNFQPQTKITHSYIKKSVLQMLVRSEMTAQLFSPSSYTYIFNLPIWKPFLNLSIGAGSGLLLTYATYMSRRNSVVKLGILLPVCNNLIRWTQLTSFVRCVVYRLGDVKCNSLEILVARKKKLQEICYFNGLSHESQTTWIAHFFSDNKPVLISVLVSFVSILSCFETEKLYKKYTKTIQFP